MLPDAFLAWKCTFGTIIEVKERHPLSVFLGLVLES